jgi:hypothetical protein
MWENNSNWLVDLIASTCFDAVEELSLCTKEGDKPPKVIQWQCWNKDETGKVPLCIECGTEKKLAMTSCPELLVDCVMEWRMGAQSDIADGEQLTQIELLESKKPVPVKEVIVWLKAQLELCCKHYGAPQ